MSLLACVILESNWISCPLDLVSSHSTGVSEGLSVPSHPLSVRFVFFFLGSSDDIKGNFSTSDISNDKRG